MIVEEQNIITIAYDLHDRTPEGELLERVDANYPFRFLFGAGRLLPEFEARLEGLGIHDSFEFTLSPEQGYGPVREDFFSRVPISLFEREDGTPDPELLVRDQFVALTDDNGRTHNGRVVEWDRETVTVDFNHAMAGKTLFFSGSILDIRPATVDELIRKHYIEEDGLRRPDFGEDDMEF